MSKSIPTNESHTLFYKEFGRVYVAGELIGSAKVVETVNRHQLLQHFGLDLLDTVE